MYLAIYKDKNNDSIKYYYEENNNIFYDLYKNNKIKKYRVNSLYEFYKLFSKDEKSTFLKHDGVYDIYVDSNNYKHYIKNGIEDFIKYYENNGVDALLYDTDKNGLKNKIKRYVLGAGILVVSVQLFYYLANFTIELALDYKQKKDSYEEFVDDVTETVTDEEILSGLDKCFSKLDPSKAELIINSNIISDILPYYNDIDKSYLYQKKLKGLNVFYADSSLRKEINGAYNESSPNIIYVVEEMKDHPDFETKVFCHEFCHLLQNKNIYNYFTEPLAELMSTEYFNFVNSNYLDEVRNLKLLICTVGREPVLRYSIGGDDSELLDIIKNNMDEDEYKNMKSMLSMGVLDYQEDPDLFNSQMRNLIEDLYYNMHGIRFKETVDFNLIAKEADYDEFILSTKENIYFDVLDNRLYLKEDNSNIVPTITFNVLSDKELNENIFGSSNIKNIENTKYYKRKLSLDEFHYYSKYPYPNPIVEVVLDEEKYCDEYFVGDDGEVYAYYMIDGEKKCLSFDEMYNAGLLTYYIINNEKDITSLSDYDLVFDTKKITVEVEPIVDKYTNNKIKK